MALQSCAYLTFDVYRRPRRSDQRMTAIVRVTGTALAMGKVGELFGADLRPLTALRVVLALLVLRDTDSITLLRGCYAAFNGMLGTWTP